MISPSDPLVASVCAALGINPVMADERRSWSRSRCEAEARWREISEDRRGVIVERKRSRKFQSA